ncbi:HNH endonuclease, partial [Paraburkholderia bryophila]|uniref:HNH endonuclease n=1 Tax=Paraburkholderia bryophila TaxID=420952 RepID=UPI0038B97578
MSLLDQRSCIYCGKVRAFTDEHVFPAGLGGDDNRFLLCGLVCGHCNTEIFSKLELRFMRSSPAAIARIFLQPTGRGRGKKASIPSIDTRSTTIFTERYGAVEAEVMASGKAALLMQLLFHGGGKVSYTGGAPEEAVDFLETVASTLGDSVFLVHK